MYTKLLDLCKATQLRIANGRLWEDNHSGSFTYTNVGSSVIDYLLIRECDFDIVSNFKVSSFNIYSDHTPLNFGIVCGNILRRQNIPNTEYEQYRSNDQKRDMFRRGLISKLPDLNSLTLTNDNLSSENICSTVNSFVEILDSVAKPLFCKSGKYKDKASFKSCKYMSKAWFDDDCKRAKDNYIEALRNFNTNRCDVNRDQLRQQKRTYKRMAARKKRDHKSIEFRRIESLKHKKPRDFWRMFSKRRQSVNDQIHLQDFFTYFRRLSTEINQVVDNEAETFNARINLDGEDSPYEELDKNITVEEVKAAIKSLKREKAPGSDNLLNEYFLETADIICSHLTDLFNGIFASGKFPESWTEGIIVPVFKKGDDTLPENYRGISLVSCLSKLFTSVINQRLCTWAETYDKLSDAQFGFRKDRSTVDAIYILQSIVQHVLNHKNRLYCAFVDLRKAFDSVYRNGLW